MNYLRKHLQMTIYLVCFNLSEPLDEQKQQVSQWLDFLNSSLPLPYHLSNAPNLMPSCRVILIGLQSDQQTEFQLTHNPQQSIAAWRSRWSRLPIMSSLFSVSSITSLPSVQRLLFFVEEECNQIFNKFAIQIPSSYRKVLSQFRNRPKDNFLVHWHDLFQEVVGQGTANMDILAFQTMLRHFAAIGRIIWLPTGFVFMEPQVASKIAAKFVSPLEVRLTLLKQHDESVQILNKSEVGSLLNINTTNNDVLARELELMVHLDMCYALHSAGSDSVFYLFPSLSQESGMCLYVAIDTNALQEISSFPSRHSTKILWGFDLFRQTSLSTSRDFFVS